MMKINVDSSLIKGYRICKIRPRKDIAMEVVMNMTIVKWQFWMPKLYEIHASFRQDVKREAKKGRNC